MEKECIRCGEVKPLDGFGLDKRKTSGRSGACKECESARQRKYYKKNRDEIVVYKKKHYADNRDKYLAHQRKYYKENLDDITAGKKKDREENPEKYAAKTAKRRAALLERIPSWSNEEEKIAIEKVYENCRLMSILTGIPHEVDHVVPMQGKNISGLHHSTNLAIIPAALNGSKNNKWEFQEVHYG